MVTRSRRSLSERQIPSHACRPPVSKCSTVSLCSRTLVSLCSGCRTPVHCAAGHLYHCAVDAGHLYTVQQDTCITVQWMQDTCTLCSRTLVSLCSGCRTLVSLCSGCRTPVHCAVDAGHLYTGSRHTACGWSPVQAAARMFPL